jgi:hypothetical protein
LQNRANVIVMPIASFGNVGQFQLKSTQPRDPVPHIRQLSLGDVMGSVQIGPLRPFQ